MYSVYPRWRGEHNFSGFDVRCDFGLSPLARGTLLDYATEQYRKRFIPAGAGNTLSNNSKVTDVSVYPRWRGEHFDIDTTSLCQIGLSPLARGTPL